MKGMRNGSVFSLRHYDLWTILYKGCIQEWAWPLCTTATFKPAHLVPSLLIEVVSRNLHAWVSTINMDDPSVPSRVIFLTTSRMCESTVCSYWFRSASSRNCPCLVLEGRTWMATSHQSGQSILIINEYDLATEILTEQRKIIFVLWTRIKQHSLSTSWRPSEASVSVSASQTEWLLLGLDVWDRACLEESQYFLLLHFFSSPVVVLSTLNRSPGLQTASDQAQHTYGCCPDVLGHGAL